MPASKRGAAVPDLGHSARDLADVLARSFRDVLVRAAGAAGYYPAVESFIQDDQLVIRADLPGLDPAHVETSVRGNRLTIKAERRRNRDEKRRKAHHLHREIAYGAFRRQLRLPEGVKEEGITATYTNGIGDALLMGFWEDSTFVPSERAVYYVRTLEIPTPRWTTYDAAFFNVDLPDGVPPTHQERAYTSPIWHTPEN